MGFDLSGQGLTGSVDYPLVTWVSGTGGKTFFETTLGYRLNDFFAIKTGYQYHTAWATNEGMEAVHIYNREYTVDFEPPSLALGAIIYAPLEKFEPYLEARLGTLLRASAEEEIEFIGSNSTYVDTIYDGLRYK